MYAAEGKALLASIKKWEDIVNGTGIDKCNENCPLCILFLNLNLNRECIRCPIATDAKRDGCMDTPYSTWYRHMSHNTRQLRANWTVKGPKQKALALAELVYLKDLYKRLKSKPK